MVQVIAGVLLLNHSPVKAFVSLVNILNRPVPLAFYTQDETAVSISCLYLWIG